MEEKLDAFFWVTFQFQNEQNSENGLFRAFSFWNSLKRMHPNKRLTQNPKIIE